MLGTRTWRKRQRTDRTPKPAGHSYVSNYSRSVLECAQSSAAFRSHQPDIAGSPGPMRDTVRAHVGSTVSPKPPERGRRVLELEVWSFSGVWSLEFGVFLNPATADSSTL